jgi:uncharacterized membrane protein YozB (DUF420 family)
MMDPRIANGFLGTEASLASDIALLAYILLIIPGMIAGFVLVRRGHYFYHQLIMTGIIIINWVIIAYLMVYSYNLTITPKIPERLGEPGYLLPTIHLITGLAAQLIGTNLVIQLWLGPWWHLRLEPFKHWMRLTLVLWLITAALGIVYYLITYVHVFMVR